MYQKILVPLDGSLLAEQALPHAEQIAGQTGAEIILLHVLDTMRSAILFSAGSTGSGSLSEGTTAPMIQNPDQVSDRRQLQALEEVQTELDKIVDRLRRRRFTAEGMADIGDPAEQIINFIAANSVDLVVMSTHGRTGIRRWLMGSVTQKVLQHASCPVLIVRGDVSD